MPRIAAIVLAAGLSSRMARNKLLLELDGSSIIQHVLNNLAASRVSEVKVVVGNRKKELVEIIAGYNVDIIENPAYFAGMSTSIKYGVQSLRENIDAIMIFLGDMPFINPTTINAIIAAYEETAAPIIAPLYDGKGGHPVLFDRRMFAELLNISGDRGARAVIDSHLNEVVWINVENPGIHQDIDTPTDYQKAVLRKTNSRYRPLDLKP